MVSSLHWTVGLSRHTTDDHNQGGHVGNVAVSALRKLLSAYAAVKSEFMGRKPQLLHPSFLIPLDALNIYRYLR